MKTKTAKTVRDIKYDTDGRRVKLPKILTIDIPEGIDADDAEEVEQFLSDEISNITGYCHFGFTID